MIDIEYLRAREARDEAAVPFLWQYVDVAMPLGEYTKEQREEAVFRMRHSVAIMQYQVPPDQR